jgi:hypothetical protein
MQARIQWLRSFFSFPAHFPASTSREVTLFSSHSGVIAKTNDHPSRIYGLLTVITRVCSTLGSMPDDEQGRSGANLLLICLAALIFGAALFMGFELTALP